MDKILSEATQKGMYLVDHENMSELFDEHRQTLERANKLSDKVDDEKTPFASKYEARKLLDTICNKLEANRTICSLEGKRNDVEILNKKISATKIVLGMRTV